MTDKLTVNRRRLLELTGVGTTVAVAGCSGQLGGDGESREVAISLALDPEDQEEIQQRQQEIQQEQMSGNASEEELQEEQEEIQELQQEAVSKAMEDAESEFEDADITIEDEIEGQGQALLLVSGSASSILDVLETEVVQAIAAASAFEQSKEAQEEQEGATQEPTG
ncbi:MAG: hypothetical protein ACOC0Z_00435 [Halohasta sp.]